MDPSEHPPQETGTTEHVLTAGQVADLVGGSVLGDPTVRVSGIAPLEQAEPEELGFLAQRKYLRFLSETRARAILVSEPLASEAERISARVVVREAHLALPALLEAFYPQAETAAEIHPTAVFEPGVTLGRNVAVGPYAVLGKGVRVEDGVRIGAHVVVGDRSVIGAGSVLHPQVVLYPGTRVGARVILHAGVRLGVDGFGYVPMEGVHRKVPQVGGCVIGDDVEIGGNTVIDRGSIGRTVIGRGSKLDNLVHLAHNVRIGEDVLITAQVGMAGSATVGDRAMFGGQAGISGHTDIGKGAKVGGQAGVIGDVTPGEAVSGYPARNHREYLRAMGMVFKLPETLGRIKEMESRIASLEGDREG